MNELSAGIVVCGSMLEAIKECLASLEGSFRIYPIIPSCTFPVKIDLFRYHLDRSIVENDVTILAYGICHPQILALLAEYGGRVVQLRGSNCFEMFLGTEKYAEYHGKCYWMLNKPFFTKWKKEMFAGFGAGTSNGRMLIGDIYKKLVYLRFEKDQLDIDLVEDFARTMGLEYEIHSADTANLKRLLEEALASASPTGRAKSLESFLKYPDKSEIQTLLENIGEIIYEIDIHTKNFTFISPQVETILGYTESEFMDIMNGYVQVPFYHEDDRERVVAGRYNFLVKCVNEGAQEPYEVEYRVKHKRGDVLWVKESIYPSYGSEGIIECFVGRIVDVTERKRAEEELRKSEERFRSLTESTSDWIWEVDQNVVYTYASPKVKELLGYEPEEVIGKTPFDLMPPDEAERVARIFQSIAESRRTFARLENTNLHKDGHLVVLESSGVPVFDASGNFRGYRGIDRDITERKRMGDALRESEERFRGIAERSFDAIITLDLAGCITYASPAAEKIIGHRPEDFIGKPFQDFLTDSEAPRVVQAFAEVVNGRSVENLQMEVRKNDGSLVIFEANASPIIRGGEIVGVQGIFRDVTERKRMEELKKLATIGELSTMVAHDLRNPLTSIRNANFYLKNAFPHLASAESKVVYEMLNTMEREIIAADNIVTDLLYFTGKRPLQIKRRNINRLMEDSLTGSNMPENVKVERNFGKRVIATADEKQLGRVFLNLIKNAVQAMPNGGKLTITTSETKDHIEITFTDTGIGVPEENVSKIFQPLFTTKAKGTGLGLPICKKIVEQHDGIIDVKSKIGQGTTFIIKLPKGEAK